MGLRGTALTRALRAQQYAVTALRSALYRANLELARDPYAVRVARALDTLGVDAVLDVGANIGQYGAGLRACGFAGRIISCEPQPDALAHLDRRARTDPKWTTVRAAVGAETGTIEVNVSANSFSSSVLPMSEAHLTAAPGSDYVGTVSSPLTTVADLMREHGLDASRTMLKSDTQGYEASVLDGAGELLGEFPLVQVEVSLVALYDGQTLADELVGRLSERGYTLYAFEPGFGDRGTGRMLQYDGLFVRSDLLPDAA